MQAQLCPIWLAHGACEASVPLCMHERHCLLSWPEAEVFKHHLFDFMKTFAMTALLDWN
jgi:hypothetical protein